MNVFAAASLVSRDSLTREGLHRILADYGFTIAQSVSNISDLVEYIGYAAEKHIIIIDDSRIGHDIADDISELCRRFSEAKIILLKEEFDFCTLRKAFEAGVDGYILKDVSHETFVVKIQLILMNQKIAPSNLFEILASFPTPPEEIQNNIADLTEREKNILGRIALGQPNKLISRELNISEATVKMALKSLYRKMSVQNRTQAALMAKSNNLLSNSINPKIQYAFTGFCFYFLQITDAIL